MDRVPLLSFQSVECGPYRVDRWHESLLLLVQQQAQGFIHRTCVLDRVTAQVKTPGPSVSLVITLRPQTRLCDKPCGHFAQQQAREGHQTLGVCRTEVACGKSGATLEGLDVGRCRWAPGWIVVRVGGGGHTDQVSQVEGGAEVRNGGGRVGQRRRRREGGVQVLVTRGSDVDPQFIAANGNLVASLQKVYALASYSLLRSVDERAVGTGVEQVVASVNVDDAGVMGRYIALRIGQYPVIVRRTTDPASLGAKRVVGSARKGAGPGAENSQRERHGRNTS